MDSAELPTHEKQQPVVPALHKFNLGHVPVQVGFLYHKLKQNALHKLVHMQRLVVIAVNKRHKYFLL